MSESPMIPGTVEEFISHLEDLIVREELAAGSKLASERQLSEQYGLGRPAVREALRRLEERGLLVVQPGRGSYVSKARPTLGTASTELLMRRSRVTARQLARARLMLECETAALAAQNRTAEQLDQMKETLASIHTAPTVDEKADRDLAFHEQIAESSGNTVLQIMFGSIRMLTHDTMVRSLGDPDVAERGEPLHRDVLAAIERQDPDAARAVMAEHLKLAEDLYGADLDVPLADVLRRRSGAGPAAPRWAR